jgi:hypothetical protein
MAKLTGKQIAEQVLGIVLANPEGIRYAAIIKQMSEQNPETPTNAIAAQVVKLVTTFPTKVSKLSKGLFGPAGETGSDATIKPVAEHLVGGKVSEDDFYQPFADWLKDEDEVTYAAPLGSKFLGALWGTPDVIGTYRSTAGDLIKFPAEIVSAEMKTDPSQSVVAFGQANAYRLFSHKTYIAMPTTLKEFDKDRLQSLCVLFGVGLVLFDLNKDAPNFSIRARAQRFSPDMFYVNKLAEGLKSHNAAVFDKLFGG